ncbi:MAG: nucleoside hydrolase [Alphaproteobacteria bacterium]|nr:nucleoside hydrolase [Alphaproteobacteria bacterium]
MLSGDRTIGLPPFVIDCDTGRDDALAIWSALALRWPLRAIVASYGNVDVEKVTDNCARVLHLAGRNDIPLLPGTSRPSRNHRGFRETVLPRQSAAGNGLCDIELPKASSPLPKPLSPAAMAGEIEKLAAENGPLHYIILGPATNFAALAGQLGANLSTCVSSVTMMGGTFSPLREELGKPDFNVVCDPFAVRDLLARNIPVAFVPVNATWTLNHYRPEAGRFVGNG